MNISRRQGKTLTQIKEAPEGAIFIWCMNNTSYPEHLARKLRRKDLKIKPLDWLKKQNLEGKENIVCDHTIFDLLPYNKDIEKAVKILERRK